MSRSTLDFERESGRVGQVKARKVRLWHHIVSYIRFGVDLVGVELNRSTWPN